MKRQTVRCDECGQVFEGRNAAQGLGAHKRYKHVKRVVKANGAVKEPAAEAAKQPERSTLADEALEEAIKMIAARRLLVESQLTGMKQLEAERLELERQQAVLTGALARLHQRPGELIEVEDMKAAAALMANRTQGI